MRKKNNIYVIVFLFLYIYYPPLISINMIHILAALSTFNMVVFYCNDKPIKLIMEIYFKNIIGYMCIAVSYLICILLVSNNELITIYPYLIIIVEIPICVMYICLYFIKNKYDIYDVLNVLLTVGIIQAIIATLCFFIPSVKDIVINVFSKSLNRANQSSELIYYMANVRLNGLSSNLTFTTPVVQTLLGLISIHLALNKNFKYIVFFPILFFSAVINARNSLIVLTYGMMILVFMSVKKPKSILKLIFISIVTIILTPIFVGMIKNSSELVFKWISDGFDEIIKFFQGNNVGYFETVTNYFIRFPEGLQIIFGTGRRIFGLELGLGSDIGYINDLWLGGIIFTSISYITVEKFYIKGHKHQNKLVKFISLLFIFTFLILNIKGTIISNNDFINFSFLLNTIFILDKKYQYFTAKN